MKIDIKAYLQDYFRVWFGKDSTIKTIENEEFEATEETKKLCLEILCSDIEPVEEIIIKKWGEEIVVQVIRDFSRETQRCDELAIAYNEQITAYKTSEDYRPLKDIVEQAVRLHKIIWGRNKK
jgi:hypothetical protein